MRRTLALVVVSLVIVGGAFSWVTAQSGASTLEGAWTIQEVTSAKPNPNLPKKPTGLAVFSGRHYAVSATDSARPDFAEGGTPKATADQLRATWGPVQSEAGTFTVTGNTLRLTRVHGRAQGRFSSSSSPQSMP